MLSFGDRKRVVGLRRQSYRRNTRRSFRRFTAAVPGYHVPQKFIGAGASSDDLNWTRGFFQSMREKGEGMFGKLYAWGIHHYCWNVSAGRTNDWNAGKGDALAFSAEQYYELLVEADKIDRYIGEHWAAMGEFDTRHRAKIVVDEWGAWHRPGTELKPEHLLGQQNTMRDALVASLTLDTFNRNSDKVVMGNVAQLVNCLQSLFLADGEKFLLTPTYHVFEMFMPHIAAQAVRTVLNSPSISYDRNGKPATFWGLNGSASVNGKEVTLTVTNSSLTDFAETEIGVRAQKIAVANARVLSAKDIHAHNTFADPKAVVPRDEAVRLGAISFSASPCVRDSPSSDIAVGYWVKQIEVPAKVSGLFPAWRSPWITRDSIFKPYRLDRLSPG